MFQERLREFLKNKFPDARNASGHKEVVIRCRFCGDSQSDRGARHLYISMGTDQAPPMYNCFKCGESGILSPKVLMELVNCEDSGELLSDLRNNNTRIIKTSKHLIKNRKVFNIKNNFISDTDLSRAKLTYINKRLGLNLTYDDLLQNKIVLNLGDLLSHNYVKTLTRYDSIVKQLDEYFVGFLSMDNGSLSLKNLVYNKRELSKSINRRYTEYSIFDKVEDNSKRFYAIPTRCNLTSPDPIHVHVAEGGFDINSIFFNLRGANRQQNIYTSVGGKAYLNVVKMYLKEIGLMNVVFHIYVDGEIPTSDIQFIADMLRPLGIPVYIHRNMCPGEKDFGVTKDRIIEQVTRL